MKANNISYKDVNLVQRRVITDSGLSGINLVPATGGLQRIEVYEGKTREEVINQLNRSLGGALSGKANIIVDKALSLLSIDEKYAYGSSLDTVTETVSSTWMTCDFSSNSFTSLAYVLSYGANPANELCIIIAPATVKVIIRFSPFLNPFPIRFLL